jgi:transcriptional regulator with XRE-family HTH domain
MGENMYRAFSQWLRTQIEQHPSLNQSGLAYALGVDRTTVSAWVTGKAAPRDHHLEAIAEIFGTTKTELYVMLGRVEPPGPLEGTSPEVITIAQRIGELPEDQREKVMRALVAILDLIVE